VSRLAARSLGAKISGGKGSSLVNIFGFYKTRHILLPGSANCTVPRAVVLTQYRRVTDRQTDVIAVASKALAMRALWRAVRMETSPRQCAQSAPNFIEISSTMELRPNTSTPSERATK